MSDSPRTRPVAPGVTAERIAHHTHFEYRPDAPADSVLTLNFREFLTTPNGVLPDRLEGTEHVSVTLGEVASRCFGKGTGEHGADLSKVSMADLLEILRGASDTLYAEAIAPTEED